MDASGTNSGTLESVLKKELSMPFILALDVFYFPQKEEGNLMLLHYPPCFCHSVTDEDVFSQLEDKPYCQWTFHLQPRNDPL